MLIETLYTPWDPASYSDTYREELLRKIEEKEPIAPAEEPGTPVDRGSRVDALMQALQASAKQRSKASGRARRSAQQGPGGAIGALVRLEWSSRLGSA